MAARERLRRVALSVCEASEPEAVARLLERLATEPDADELRAAGPGRRRCRAEWRGAGATPMTPAVRVCAEHRRALAQGITGRGGQTRETLTCPVGGHEVERWLVVDASRGVVLAGATFERVTLLGVFDPIGDFRPRLVDHMETADPMDNPR